MTAAELVGLAVILAQHPHDCGETSVGKVSVECFACAAVIDAARVPSCRSVDAAGSVVSVTEKSRAVVPCALTRVPLASSSIQAPSMESTQLGAGPLTAPQPAQVGERSPGASTIVGPAATSSGSAAASTTLRARRMRTPR
jgi:hypothetical protein